MNNLDGDYRDVGISTYGHRCEICGYPAMVEVHHIDYHLHQWHEDNLRMATKSGKDIMSVLAKAQEKGFKIWDGKDLSKDSRPSNLAVLCGNCHALIHKLDAGTNLFRVLQPRRKD